MTSILRGNYEKKAFSHGFKKGLPALPLRECFHPYIITKQGRIQDFC